MSVMAALALACAPPLGAYERLDTRGRRVFVQGDLMVVTAPELDRVALYDVAGERPRKLGEFGEQGQEPGLLLAPHGAALRAPDELLVADTFNQRVQVFDLAALADGRRPPFRRAAGSPGARPGQLASPMSGLAYSSDPMLQGLLFVADTGNDRVQAWDRELAYVRAIGAPGDEPGRLGRPSGLAFDPSGRALYVAEERNRRVSAFDARSGALLFVFAGCADEPLHVPAGLAVAPDGDVLVADRVRRRVLRLRPERGPDGLPRGLRCTGGFGRSGGGPGEFQYPQAIAVDARGRVYVCDQADSRCQAFAPDGQFLFGFADDWQAPEWSPPVASAAPDAGGERVLCSGAGSFGVRLTSAPESLAPGEAVELRVELTHGCGAGRPPAEGVELRVSGLMPAHRHGLPSAPRVRPLGRARFAVEGLRLHMPGRWELHFDLWRGTRVERAQWDLELR